MRENQKGFSLIELMVSVAILAIISGAIVGFLQVSSNFYQNISCDVDLQYEAQQVINQIENLLVDSTKGISYQASANELYVYEDTTRHSIRWDSAANKLFYSKADYKKNGDGSSGFQGTSTSDALMAEYVSGFSVSLDSAETTRTVVLTLDLTKAFKTCHVSQTITLRNAIAVNQSESELYDETKQPTVSSVAIWYDGAEVTTGSVEFQVGSGTTKRFSAVVKGNNNPSMDVIWSLEADQALSGGTGLEYTGNGVIIRVDASEQNSVLILKAVSKADSNRSAQVAIQLIHKEITGISITGPESVYRNTEFTIEIAVTGNEVLAVPDDVELLQKNISGATLISGPTWDSDANVYICKFRPTDTAAMVRITYGAKGTERTATYEKKIGYRKYTAVIRETQSSTALTAKKSEIWRNQSKTFEVELTDETGKVTKLDGSAIQWSCNAYNDASCAKGTENSSVLSSTSFAGNSCTVGVGVYNNVDDESRKFVYEEDYAVRVSAVIDLPDDADTAVLNAETILTVPPVAASGLTTSVTLRVGRSTTAGCGITGIVLSGLNYFWNISGGNSWDTPVTVSSSLDSENTLKLTISLRNNAWGAEWNCNLCIDNANAASVSFRVIKR